MLTSRNAPPPIGLFMVFGVAWALIIATCHIASWLAA